MGGYGRFRGEWVNIRILKAYLQYTFTVERVNEALLFEVTTSRSCEDVSGFHNVMFGPAGKARLGTCARTILF